MHVVSIHARRVMGNRFAGMDAREAVVSIHARRVTGDVCLAALSVLALISIHARRVTGDAKDMELQSQIDIVSIHARRVTGDTCRMRRCRRRRCFNSRPSCDGRLTPKVIRLFGLCFNSRPSCDGRLINNEVRSLLVVSIHARRVTGDFSAARRYCSMWFQFTPVV